MTALGQTLHDHRELEGMNSNRLPELALFQSN